MNKALGWAFCAWGFATIVAVIFNEPDWAMRSLVGLFGAVAVIGGIQLIKGKL